MIKNETWKPVTIGGFTGILMGAASAYGVHAATSNNAPVSELETKPADNDGHDVKADDLSFKEAFEAARAQMGPGHVFTWRGNLYNTYTADEWNAKTEHEQQQMVEQVTAETTPQPTETEESETSTSAEDDVRVASVNTNTYNIQTNNYYMNDNDAATTSVNDDDNDDDVRVVGAGDVELSNGRVISVQELEINGQRVAIIDVDQDGVADLAASDLNHNNHPDAGEVIDLHTGEPLSFTNSTDDSLAYTENVDDSADILPTVDL